jgi:hypothetical protein
LKVLVSSDARFNPDEVFPSDGRDVFGTFFSGADGGFSSFDSMKKRSAGVPVVASTAASVTMTSSGRISVWMQRQAT